MAAEGFSYLWRRVTPNAPNGQLYETLKMIYRRLQSGAEPGVIIPETVSNMNVILESDDHPAHVKCVLCHVLKRLCYNEVLAKLLVRRGLMKSLNDLLVAWTQHTDPVSQTDCWLIDSQLAVLETLSHHHQTFFTHFMDLNMLRPLCQLCGPQCQTTFRFGNHSHETFRSLTAGVYPGLIGNVKPVHEDLRWETYEEHFGVEYELLNLPDRVLSIELYDTSDTAKDVNIATEMRAKQASWPAMEDVVPMMQRESYILQKDPDQSDVESDWRDIYVTSIVDGCQFWGQLGGTESFAIVKEIDCQLCDWPEKTGVLSTPPVGMAVGVKDEQLGYFRGQVTAVRGDIAEVHATDYGCRRLVCWRENQDVFQLDPELDLDRYPPQATLCILQDVSPPPLSGSAITSLAAILRNLATEAGTSYALFCEVEVMRTLQYLVACPEPTIVRPAAQALSNLSHYLPLRIKLSLQKTLHVLLGKLQEYAPLLDNESIAKAAYSILGAITNLLFDYSNNQQEFYNSKGLHLVVSLLSAGSERIRMAACRALAMYVGYAIPTVVIDALQSRRTFPISAVALGQLQDGMRALGLDPRGGVVRGRSRDRRSDPAPPQVQNTREAQRPEPELVSERSAASQRSQSRERGRTVSREQGRSASRTRDSSNSSCDRRARALSKERLEESDSESDEDLLSSLVGKKRLRSGGDTSDGEILAELAKPFSGEGDSAVHGLNTATVYRKFSSQNAYVRGRTVDFTNDLQHDIRPFENITKVSRSQMLSAVCGLLNAGSQEGGSIYFGLLQNGVVVGIAVDRSQRDTLRTSIDALMRKLTPTVTCSHYGVEYHQVVEHKPETGQFKPIKDLYVVEIKIRPTIDVVYMLPSEEMYVREGGTTDEMTMQMLHERTVEEAERRKLSEIETLERELSIWSRQIT